MLGGNGYPKTIFSKLLEYIYTKRGNGYRKTLFSKMLEYIWAKWHIYGVWSELVKGTQTYRLVLMGEGVLLRPKAPWFKINIYHLLIRNSRTTWPLRFNCSFWVPWNVLCKMNVLLFTNIWQNEYNFTIHVWVLGYLIFPLFLANFSLGGTLPQLDPLVAMPLLSSPEVQPNSFKLNYLYEWVYFVVTPPLANG